MQLAYTCQNGRRFCEPHVASVLLRLLIPANSFAFCSIKDQTSPINKESVGSICEQRGVALEHLHGGGRGRRACMCLLAGKQGTGGLIPKSFSSLA